MKERRKKRKIIGKKVHIISALRNSLVIIGTPAPTVKRNATEG